MKRQAVSFSMIRFSFSIVVRRKDASSVRSTGPCQGSVATVRSDTPPSSSATIEKISWTTPSFWIVGRFLCPRKSTEETPASVINSWSSEIVLIISKFRSLERTGRVTTPAPFSFFYSVLVYKRDFLNTDAPCLQVLAYRVFLRPRQHDFRDAGIHGINASPPY